MSGWSLSAAAELFDESLHELGRRSMAAKEARFGKSIFWIDNCHINYTNTCEGICSFCRYRRGRDEDGAFALSVDEVLAQASDAAERGAREIHVVGGLNGSLGADYYVNLVGRIRRDLPHVYIKAFTAVEVDFVCRRFEMEVDGFLGQLRDAGLNCLAGGGAEMFSPRVRSMLCPEKLSGDRWLEIHRKAHRLGLRSNATMLFGHVETPVERAEHLLKLRELQNETGGFQSFLPLPVVDFDGRIVGGVDVLKTVAVSRLVVDNIEHIKVFWPIWTVKLAQLGLSYGADDFDGTVGHYRVVRSGGPDYAAGLERREICRLIEEAGGEPLEREGDYGLAEEVVSRTQDTNAVKGEKTVVRVGHGQGISDER